MAFANIQMDIDAIPGEFKLSPVRISQKLASFKQEGKSDRDLIVKKKAFVEDAMMAVMEDVQLLSQRLSRLNVSPDIARSLDGILGDFRAGYLVELSRIARLTTESELEELKKNIFVYGALKSLRFDLTLCVHNWQLCDALLGCCEG